MANLEKIMQQIVTKLRKVPNESRQPLQLILAHDAPGKAAVEIAGGGPKFPFDYDFQGYPEMQRAQSMINAAFPDAKVSLYHKGADAAAVGPEDRANFPLPRR